MEEQLGVTYYVQYSLYWNLNPHRFNSHCVFLSHIVHNVKIMQNILHLCSFCCSLSVSFFLIYKFSVFVKLISKLLSLRIYF